MNLTFFFHKKITKFIVFAPAIFVTQMSRSCHKRVMEITGAKTMNFVFSVKSVKFIVFAPVNFVTRMVLRASETV